MRASHDNINETPRASKCNHHMTMARDTMTAARAKPNKTAGNRTSTPAHDTADTHATLTRHSRGRHTSDPTGRDASVVRRKVLCRFAPSVARATKYATRASVRHLNGARAHGAPRPQRAQDAMRDAENTREVRRSTALWGGFQDTACGVWDVP